MTACYSVSELPRDITASFNSWHGVKALRGDCLETGLGTPLSLGLVGDASIGIKLEPAERPQGVLEILASLEAGLLLFAGEEAGRQVVLVLTRQIGCPPALLGFGAGPLQLVEIEHPQGVGAPFQPSFAVADGFDHPLRARLDGRAFGGLSARPEDLLGCGTLADAGTGDEDDSRHEHDPFVVVMVGSENCTLQLSTLIPNKFTIQSQGGELCRHKLSICIGTGRYRAINPLLNVLILSTDCLASSCFVLLGLFSAGTLPTHCRARHRCDHFRDPACGPART